MRHFDPFAPDLQPAQNSMRQSNRKTRPVSLESVKEVSGLQQIMAARRCRGVSCPCATRRRTGAELSLLPV